MQPRGSARYESLFDPHSVARSGGSGFNPGTATHYNSMVHPSRAIDRAHDDLLGESLFQPSAAVVHERLAALGVVSGQGSGRTRGYRIALEVGRLQERNEVVNRCLFTIVDSSAMRRMSAPEMDAGQTAPVELCP